MNKSELAKLALRLYCDKGYWHNDLVQRIIAKTDYYQILKYDLGGENTIKNDIEMLQDLVKTYNGLFIDLFSLDEIMQRHIFIPASERSVYDTRYNDAMKNRLGEDLYNFIIAIVECEVPIPNFFNTELKELCSLARHKFALEHNLSLDCVDNETLPFEDESSLDLFTSDGQEDEPAVVTQSTHNSKPVHVTSEPPHNGRRQGLQLRRAFSSTFEV